MDEGTALILQNRRGQVLLQLREKSADRYPDCWDFVGGYVEPGETILETMERETREELGYQLREAVYLGAYVHEDTYNHVFYAVTDVPAESMEFSECQDARFFPVEDALELPLAFSSKELLKAFL